MNNQQTRRAILFVAFFCLIGFNSYGSAVGADVRPREFRGRTMGTTYMVKVFGADEVDDDTLRVKIDAELRSVNDQMSTYLKSSEITAFNQSASTEWFSVSPEFANVVRSAIEISRLTDGAFDITVGPLINAWSFGAAERTKQVPSESKIESLLKQIGYEKLSVRVDPPALKKSDPGLRIDLSAIAKGHGVDRVVGLLNKLGVQDVFVEVGGEVRTTGAKPEGAWRVGIQLPDARSNMVMIAHAMKADAPAGSAMATSGDYRNFFEVNGKRYSHTIDPRNGKPVEHELASVSVVANSCMEADGWATALNVVGPQRGLELAVENELSVLLVSRTTAENYEMNGTGILAQYAQVAAASVDSSAAPDVSIGAAIVPVAILTFGVFSILLCGMAIGVMFGRKSISGSCGGIANKTNEDGSASCALCSSPSDACKELRDKMAAGKPE